eukprot:TRINITY_DN528_c0_g1_i3.p1 TRINITY_DN528_c0_g1~~TRINITY_DN528_c0_g1_i3.p1  ORF type:complete len:437 (-),score=15.52 TRINITY_DN528_c0_g1_i3:278-1588(-)
MRCDVALDVALFSHVTTAQQSGKQHLDCAETTETTADILYCGEICADTSSATPAQRSRVCASVGSKPAAAASGKSSFLIFLFQFAVGEPPGMTAEDESSTYKWYQSQQLSEHDKHFGAVYYVKQGFHIRIGYVVLCQNGNEAFVGMLRKHNTRGNLLVFCVHVATLTGKVYSGEEIVRPVRKSEEPEAAAFLEVVMRKFSPQPAPPTKKDIVKKAARGRPPHLHPDKSTKQQEEEHPAKQRAFSQKHKHVSKRKKRHLSSKKPHIAIQDSSSVAEQISRLTSSVDALVHAQQHDHREVVHVSKDEERGAASHALLAPSGSALNFPLQQYALPVFAGSTGVSASSQGMCLVSQPQFMQPQLQPQFLQPQLQPQFVQPQFLQPQFAQQPTPLGFNGYPMIMAPTSMMSAPSAAMFPQAPMVPQNQQSLTWVPFYTASR